MVAEREIPSKSSSAKLDGHKDIAGPSKNILMSANTLL